MKETKIQNCTESRTWIQEKEKVKKRKKLEIRVDRLSTTGNQARPADGAVELREKAHAPRCEKRLEYDMIRKIARRR